VPPERGGIGVIEIEEPPDIRACAEHQVPVVWLYSARAEKWKAYVPVDGDTDTIRRHRCEYHGDPEPAWRQLELQTPESIHAGAALVRAELEKNASKEQR
jgi:hypothetical protein